MYSTGEGELSTQGFEMRGKVGSRLAARAKSARRAQSSGHSSMHRLAMCAAWCALSLATVFGIGVATAHADRTVADLDQFSHQARVVWETSTVPYEIATSYLPGSLALVSRAIREGMERWEAEECGFQGFQFTGTRSVAVSGDGKNTIEWISTGWTASGYPREAMAVSEIVYGQSPLDGTWVIREADLYVNGQHFRWASNTNDDTSNLRSIQAMITHETGHWLGLLHPCAIDDAEDAPPCVTTPAYDTSAMHPLYDGLGRLSLDLDDLEALCRQYPPIPCAGGCATAERCVRGTCTPKPRDPKCKADADCAEFQECFWGSCVGLLRPGDRCTADDECRHATCLGDGYCTPSCGDIRCGPAGQCFDQDARAFCQLENGLFGDECTQGKECLSGLCVGDGPGEGICTRECGPREPCPRNSTCGVVGGLEVCVPTSPPGGCAASGAPSQGACAYILIFCAIVYTFGVKRRRSSNKLM